MSFPPEKQQFALTGSDSLSTVSESLGTIPCHNTASDSVPESPTSALFPDSRHRRFNQLRLISNAGECLALSAQTRTPR